MTEELQPPEHLRDEILCVRPSAEARRIEEIVRDDRAPMQSLEAALAGNPVFAARLLTLINFAAGLPHRVISLGSALSLLGLDRIKPLALGLLAFDLTPRPSSDDESDLARRLDLRDLWEGSLGSAAIASQLALEIPGISPLDAFTAGFVHDIGRVVLFHHAPHSFSDAVLQTLEKAQTICAAETMIFGIDHVTLGDGWCQRYDLSPGLQDIVRLHHGSLATLNTDDDKLTRRSIAMIQASESACKRLEIGRFSENLTEGADAWRVLGLRERDWQKRHAVIKHEIEAARELFGLPRQNHRWVHRIRKPKSTPDHTVCPREEKSHPSANRAQVIAFPLAPSVSVVPENQASAKKPVLLVVEDHTSFLEMVTLFMVRQGYQVKTASNGESALEILSREEIHLVLLDLMMPKLDGFEVLRQLHKTQHGRFPYIIVASAAASDADRRKVLDLGANEYLPKPVHLKRLLERVQAVERFLF